MPVVLVFITDRDPFVWSIIYAIAALWAQYLVMAETMERLWRWAGTWKVWEIVVGVVGAGMIAMSEPALATFVFAVAFLSVLSKIWHLQLKSFWKIVAGLVSIIVFAFVVFVINSERERQDRPWSHVLLEHLGARKTLPPSYPPDYSQFPKAVVPIPESPKSYFADVTPPIVSLTGERCSAPMIKSVGHPAKTGLPDSV